MPTEIGFSTQTPSLPKGGGTGGLGETFTPDLSSGTGGLVVPIDLPNGPNDIGPRLSLRYDSSAANGPFGLGWALALPSLTRSTTGGLPRYDETDTLVLAGAGPLLRTAAGLRPEVESGEWRVAHADPAAGDAGGFVATDRSGTRFHLGTSAESRVPGVGGVPLTWLLARIEDNLGTSAELTWEADGAQRYLASVAYGPFEVRLDHEPRPDVLRWSRAGFVLVTDRRCASVELHLAAPPAGEASLVRRWSFGYVAADPSGVSLLASVTLTGVAADSSSLDAPPLRLAYAGASAPRLTAVPCRDERSAPPGLGAAGDRRSRVELLDWTGNGLPDLVEVSPGGVTRVWPDEAGTWGRPRLVGELPQLADAAAGIALVDLDGNGFADLVRSDVPARGYQPRGADGLGRPVTWTRGPSVAIGAAQARLVDLDGDGLGDLVWSNGRALLLARRTEDAAGWVERPDVVPQTPNGPPADLADPHVHLADMTGDGTPDVVRVDGAGVTYWPHLGRGTFGDAVRMTGAPTLPFDVDPSRVLVVDVDGDGSADVVVLGDGTLTWWPNRSGDGFESPRTVRHLPTGAMDDVRVADLLGTGVPAVVWSTPLPSGRARWFALDLLGGARPGLLTSIDNSVGRVTSIRYTTSARESERDRVAGQAWTSSFPLVLPVVAGVRVAETTTGEATDTDFRYHEGRYDPVLREVCGFGRVEELTHGDARVAAALTTRWFHTGVDPSTGAEPGTAAERRRLRAVRGRLFRLEVAAGLDDAAPSTPLAAGLPLHRIEQTWRVDDSPDAITVVPRLVRTDREVLEGGAVPVGRVVTEQLAWDAVGNVAEAVESTFEAGAAPTGQLHTYTQYAVDPTGRFAQRACRIVQTDGAGALLADTRTEYDGRPFGQVGAQGLTTGRSSFALPDELVGDVYGAAQPDWAALGYEHRAASVPTAGATGIESVAIPAGWWVRSAEYTRTVAADGVVHGTVRNALGAMTELELDPTACYPARVRDAVGNEVRATFDLRTYQPLEVVEPSGAVSVATFDALARPVHLIEPGDSPATPTTAHAYDTSALPVSVSLTRRAGTDAGGELPRLRERQLVDGEGRLLQRRVLDASAPAGAGADPEIVQVSHAYGARGLVTESYLPYRAAGPAYDPPDPARPHSVMEYDPLGRLLRATRADGEVATVRYLPGRVEETDEAGHLTVRRLDATGQAVAIEQHLDGRTLTSTFTFALSGSLLVEQGPTGARTAFRYDLLGRVLATERPEAASVIVLDAAGRTVETRAGAHRVLRSFDAGDRLVAIREDDPAAVPVATFTYHDAAAPAPADAGAHTAGGRLLRVDDEVGSTALDYDERGRVARKTMTRPGSDVLTIWTAYRPDGLTSAVTYPDGSVVGYRYDAAGRLTGIDDVIVAVDYDLMDHRTRVRYANGVEQTDSHDPLTGWRATSRLAVTAGAIVDVRDVTYTHDALGNVASITGPTPAQTWAYAYDELSRLVHADGLGAPDGVVPPVAQVWSYAYDDAGNLTTASDVGQYLYGQDGAAPSCVTSAGGGRYAYDDTGHVTSAPWGTHTLDARGMLRRVALSTGTVHRYGYDHAGRLALHEVSGAGATSRTWSPDGLVSVDDDGLVLQVTDGRAIVARRRAVPTGGPATPARTRTTWLHRDHLGSVVALTDGAGQVVLRVRYGPYGQVLERTGVGAVPQSFGTGLAPVALAGPASGVDAPPLVLLGARWYCPALGRFLSPDPMVTDAADPLAWNSYAYCRDNPTSYIDPSGREFWKIFAAVVATIAIIAVIVVVSVFTFGAGAAPSIALGATGISVTWTAVFAATVIGVVAGGVIGGIAAARAGGDAGDVVLGVLVGGAVGGWAAFGAAIAGPAVAGGLGLTGGSVAAGAVAGAVTGAINGAAMGFASGFAGGRNGGIGDIMEKVLVGAIIGLVVGAALGALSGLKPPAGEGPLDSLRNAARADPNPPPPPLVTPPPVNSVGQALGATGGGLAGKFAGALLPHVAQAVAGFTGSVVAQTVVVDLASGVTADLWDDIQAYVRTHNIDLGPFNFLSGGF
ncbi:toxin TcdB middle/N-terminal domain-containing protein [Cellulomonas sp. P5_C6]